MLITMKQLLQVAHEHKFAVGAFNIGNGEFLKTIIETAEAKKSPVILAIHPSELDFLSESFVAYCREAAVKATVPVVIHLDHGSELRHIMRAIRCGFTSVMMDGSTLPYEENVKVTASAVEIARAVGVSVEGELGTVGQAEGSMEGGASEDEILYTDPEQAVDFVERTGIDSLAVAVGTAHGIYPKTKRPKLQLDRLREINEKVSVPLVLHGGSDNAPDEVATSVGLGISKINISSEMKRAFFTELRTTLDEMPGAFEPTELFPRAMEAAKQLIAMKMELFQSVDKAGLYDGSGGVSDVSTFRG